MNEDRDTSRRDEPITRFWQKISLVAEISSVCRCLNVHEPDFSEVLSLVQRIIPFDGATLTISERFDAVMAVRTDLGAPVPLPGLLAEPPKDSPDDRGPRLREPVILTTDPSEDTSEYESIMIVPLILDEQVIGYLNLGSYHDGVLSEKQLKLMSIVADQLAISIERLSRLAEAETRNRTLERSHERLRNQQEKLIANEKLLAVTQLAASINHQINNPLAVILGQVQLMLWDEASLTPDLKIRLQRVEAAAIRISDASRKLLRMDETASEAGAASTDPGGSANDTKQNTGVPR